MVYHGHCLRPHWHLLCIFTPKNNNNLINVFDCRLGKVIDKRLHQSRINFIPCLGMGFVPCNAITLRIYHTQNELFVIATATYLRRIVTEICIRTYLPTAIHTSLVSLSVCGWYFAEAKTSSTLFGESNFTLSYTINVLYLELRTFIASHSPMHHRHSTSLSLIPTHVWFALKHIGTQGRILAINRSGWHWNSMVQVFIVQAQQHA